MDVSITELLDAWREGDRGAENALVDRVYPILRGLARAQLKRLDGPITLSTTDLAHEAYERLHQQREVDWRNRSHFYAIAATVMRRLVVDHLRQRSAEKRGGQGQRVDLDELREQPSEGASVQIDWLALDQALTELARDEPDCARVVELRVFTGLSVADIAEVMNSSVATVGRQWRFARTWLAVQLDYTVGDDEQA